VRKEKMSIYDKVGSNYDSMRGNIGVKDILHEIDILGKDLRVLDLSCGTGHPIAKAVSPLVKEYCGIDNSQPMLDAYLTNVQNASFRLLDMKDIDQISGKWDFIFSWGAICHLPIEFQKKTMSAVSKLLKPEGRFLFTSGRETEECSGRVGKFTVYHYSMGRTAYIEYLKKQNMELIDSSFTEGENYLYKFRKGT
jgi:cyclopropane fatty-acyl-phospholipid synthase-like methyltransferase